MKKILMGLFACMLVLGIAVPSNAIMFAGYPLEDEEETSWGQYFVTENMPTLVNLWSSQPFGEAFLLDGDWQYWQDDEDDNGDVYWVQWQPTATEDYGNGEKNILVQQWWDSAKETPLYLDVVETYYNSEGEKVYFDYALEWTGDSDKDNKYEWIYQPLSKFGDYTDAHNEPPGEMPVPEPATMLLLGAGLIGMAAFGRKKFFRKS